MQELRYIDAHCHLHFSQYDDDRDAVRARMAEQGVGAVVVGVDLASSRAAHTFAETNENIWATVGLHPADNKQESFDADSYGELVASERVRMVGECGLDYFHGKEEDERKRQRAEFDKQIAFGLAEDLPLMLHVRDAHADALALLREYKGAAGGRLRGNAHFFTGTLEEAKGYWELGFSTSFPGVVTFTSDYDEVVRNAPQELIIAETDSPYAAPQPHRGKRNEPSFVPLVVKRLAEIRGEDEDTLRRQILENTLRMLAPQDTGQGAASGESRL